MHPRMENILGMHSNLGGLYAPNASALRELLGQLFKLASKHALTLLFKGSSIFWVRVNLEYLL